MRVEERQGGARAASLAALLVLTPQIATAQTAALPPSLDPGQIERRFELPLALPSAEPAAPPAGAAPQELPARAQEIPSFTLVRLEIEPSSVYSEGELLALAPEMVPGATVSVADLFELANRVTAKYGGDGYITSRAYIPPQDIGTGVARINILEAFVDEVQVQGLDRRGFLRQAGEVIASEANRPFNYRVLERHVLLNDDLPGYESVEAIMRASPDTPRASRVILVSKPEPPVGFRLSLDNRGTDSLGPLQVDSMLTFRNLFDAHEQSRIRYVQTTDLDELTYLSFQHERPLTENGLKLGLEATRSWSQPSGPILSAIELEGDSLSGTATLSYPFIRSRAQNLNGALSFQARETETHMLGNRTGEDSLRVLRAALTGDKADGFNGVTQGQVRLSKGLDLWGGTKEGDPMASREGASSDFWKIDASVARRQSLPGGFSLNLSAQGQYGFDNLLSSEECGLGGESFGRAYDSSEITGDHCLAASAELSYLLRPPVELVRYVQLYGFYDVGRVWQENAQGVTTRSSLASAGGGVRFGLGSHVTGSVELAKPLTRDVANEGDRDARAFFRLTADF